MKKINKNDLKVNVTDVTSLNDTGIVPDAERIIVLNQMAVSDAETYPTCIIETDKSDCCIDIPSKVNCLDTDICVKTLDNCVETVDQCIFEPID